jgi:energy-coupling factor transporter ATP-binding protein EcfA2
MFDFTTSTTNPFPGLRPFEAHENHLFFGRDEQSDDLLQRLSRQRFIAVIGTSGSGKSSLVRAGLLPALDGGFMLRAGSNWRVAVMRPGGNPIGRLAQALCDEDVLGLSEVEDGIRRSIAEASLRRSALGLIEVVKQAHLGAQDNLLIVVDQFEELFRTKSRPSDGGTDDAAAFVKLLLEAAAQSEAPIYVLITMRSDFLGDCAQFRDLPEAINDSQYLIPRMTRDQRREAINGPAAVGGAQIAPRLVNRLLNDVGDNPDQLPVLQHALMRMWQQWEKAGDSTAPLDLTHYKAIGGLDEAISRHADEAYDELPDDRSRRIAEILFKLLTERGGDNRETRRPVRLAEICAIAEAEEGEALAVIEAFRREGRSFLMPPPGVKLRPNTFIDISHESLIRGWHRLRGWVDDEALSARIYRRLAETAVLYRAGEAGLWRDPDLAIALAWREKNRPNAAWGARYSPDFDAAMSFLDESQRARDAERTERARMRRRQLRLMEALAAVLLIGFCVSVALGAYAVQQREQARARLRQAEDSAQLAKQNEQRAKEAEEVARREQERAEENAKLAKQAEEKATASARLAEENARKAMQNLVAADAAKKLAVAERDNAVRAQERAKASELAAIKSEQEAIASRLLSDNLRIRNRRKQVESDASRLDLARQLGELSATSPERAFWLTQQGESFASLGNPGAAILLFSSALKEEPGYFSALSGRGYQYLINRQTQKGLSDIEQALAANGGSPYLYLHKTIGLSYQGDYGEAAKTIRQGIDKFTHVGYGEYREMDVADEIQAVTEQQAIYVDSDAALTAFHYEMVNLAAAQGSADFAALLQQADARARPSDRQQEEALSQSLDSYFYALNLSLLSYKERQRNRHNDYGALVAQGALWRRAGYCQKAADAYNSFIKIHAQTRDPRYEGLANWLAARPPEELRGTGDNCLGGAQARRGRETARDYLLKANEYAWKSEWEKAGEAYSDAVAEGKGDPDFLIERMKFRYFNRGDFAGAKEDAEELLKSNAGAPLASNAGAALAYLLRAMSKSKLNASDTTIVDDFNEARRLDQTVIPSIIDTPDNGGKVLVEVLAKLKSDAAVDLLERYIKYIKPSSYPHYLLAKLLNDQGKFEEARAQIEVAIAMDRTRFDYIEEKLRAEAGVRARSGKANGGNVNPADVQRTRFTYYVEAADSLSQRTQRGAALSAYGESLKVLNEIAGLTKNAEDVRCEVSVVVGKMFNLLKAQGSKAEAISTIDALYGKLGNVTPLIKNELKNLSAAP